MEEIEIWKDIPEYEGLYQASNLDKIKSFYSNKLLRYGPHPGGYLSVSLHKDKKGKTFTVHKLICLTFKGEKPIGYEINHIDKDKTNNREDNLEYVTHIENEEHKRNFEGYICPSIAKRKAISQFTLEGEYLRSYISLREAGRINNIDNSHISRACKGKLKTSGGFIWKYKKD